MCTPFENCCCCVSLRTGVRLICILLIVGEIGLLVHNSILVDSNNGEFLTLTGRTVDNYYIQLVGIISIYSIGITLNSLLLWATGTSNKWLVLPWLIFYIFVIFCLFCSVPMIIIWFVWLQPAPLWALLSVATFSGGLIMMYFWVIVNGFFVTLLSQENKI